VTIDRDRAQVYAAELAAYDGTDLEVLVRFDDLVALGGRVCAEPWWPRGAVRVVRARGDARSSRTPACRGGHEVRLAAPQMTAATLVHELAHVLAGVAAGHGPRFRRAHVDIAASVFGGAEAGWLADAYAAAGLRLAARSWEEPRARGPIAL
jgi:hypothetical protein